MSVGQLVVCAAVAAVVGAEDLARLEARAAVTGYDCADCGEPAAVIVRAAGPDIAWARISHQRCSASRVQELPAVLPGETAIQPWPGCYRTQPASGR